MAEVKTENPVTQLLDELGSEQPGSFISCRFCRTPITESHAAIKVGINHQHRFTNPQGIIYTLHCFHSAPGCTISGTATEAFSWFGGYSWQYASCSQCQAHLGWYYQGHKQRSFFGLIPDRLCEDDAGKTDP
jgi:hypothetical protein